MVGNRIKSLRESIGLTQSELAKKLNITRSSVNAWEMGISSPSTQYVVELSELFSVSTDYILGINHETTLNLDALSEQQKKLVLSLVQYFLNE